MVRAVGEGAYLGRTGTDTSCGGSVTGAHVHFALRQNGAYVPLHGSRRVGVGGDLLNHGELGLNSGIVDAFDDPSVNLRSGPGTGFPIVGTVADGTTVDIVCSANGTSHTGRWGISSLWNRLPEGSWISDAFVWTGTSSPVNGIC